MESSLPRHEGVEKSALSISVQQSGFSLWHLAFGIEPFTVGGNAETQKSDSSS